jgi:hypothetical protein
MARGADAGIGPRARQEAARGLTPHFLIPPPRGANQGRTPGAGWFAPSPCLVVAGRRRRCARGMQPDPPGGFRQSAAEHPSPLPAAAQPAPTAAPLVVYFSTWRQLNNPRALPAVASPGPYPPIAIAAMSRCAASRPPGANRRNGVRQRWMHWAASAPPRRPKIDAPDPSESSPEGPDARAGWFAPAACRCRRQQKDTIGCRRAASPRQRVFEALG